MEFVLLLDETRKRGQARVPERPLHLEVGLLRKVPDPRGPGAGYRSRRGFILPDEDAQEGGLATAIGADDREPRALGNGKTEAAEDVFRAEGFGEGGGGYQ